MREISVRRSMKDYSEIIKGLNRRITRIRKDRASYCGNGKIRKECDIRINECKRLMAAVRRWELR